ncbi:hypothetical protein ABT353_42730 [Nonomuraea wenchangensis]
MAAKDILPAQGEWFDETLATASPDVLREMVVRMAQVMKDAEVEQRRIRRGVRGADELAQRVSAAGVGHPRGDGGCCFFDHDLSAPGGGL